SWWLKSLLDKVVKLFRLLAMIVTSAQMGIIGLIIRGEHIFPMIGNVWLQYHITLCAAILPNAKHISVKLSKANTSQCFILCRCDLYIKRKRFCRGDRLEMDHHNPQCSPSLIFLLPLSSPFLKT
ncbi:hypothetical protein Bca52824_025183, partial [Brassica carinata]